MSADGFSLLVVRDKKKIEIAFEEYVLCESAIQALELIRDRYPEDTVIRGIISQTEGLSLSARARYLDALSHSKSNEGRPVGRDRGLRRRERVR